jgi:hypothetical protein
MQGENLRKFMETRAPAPRARYALILLQPKTQYRHVTKARLRVLGAAVLSNKSCTRYFL